MGNAYLFHGLKKGPLIVKWILENAPTDVYDHKTDPSRFSFREIIAHLADWEPIVLQRMQQTLGQPGSELKVWDEEQMAIDHEYSKTDPWVEFERWLVDRDRTIEFLQGDGNGKFELSAVHPERGVQTIYDMANLELGHDTYHVEQLLQFLPKRT